LASPRDERPIAEETSAAESGAPNQDFNNAGSLDCHSD
jgi:hypothetical protein